MERDHRQPMFLEGTMDSIIIIIIIIIIMYNEDDPIKKLDNGKTSSVCGQEQKMHQGLDGTT